MPISVSKLNIDEASNILRRLTKLERPNCYWRPRNGEYSCDWKRGYYQHSILTDDLDQHLMVPNFQCGGVGWHIKEAYRHQQHSSLAFWLNWTLPQPFATMFIWCTLESFGRIFSQGANKGKLAYACDSHSCWGHCLQALDNTRYANRIILPRLSTRLVTRLYSLDLVAPLSRGHSPYQRSTDCGAFQLDFRPRVGSC
jgi:hypothetical protein